jgi:hypothetical protein
MLDNNEFDALAEKILAAKGIKSLLVEHEEELIAAVDDEDLNDDLDDEEGDDEDHDEFGFNDLSNGIDADDLK